MEELKSILARFFRELADYFEDSGPVITKEAKGTFKYKRPTVQGYDGRHLDSAFNDQEIDEIHFGIQDFFKKDNVHGMSSMFNSIRHIKHKKGEKILTKEGKCKVIARTFKCSELMFECCDIFKDKVFPFLELKSDHNGLLGDQVEIEDWILLDKRMSFELVDSIYYGLEYHFDLKGIRSIFLFIYNQGSKKRLNKQDKCKVIVRAFKYCGCISKYCSQFEKKVRPFLVYPSQ